MRCADVLSRVDAALAIWLLPKDPALEAAPSTELLSDLPELPLRASAEVAEFAIRLFVGKASAVSARRRDLLMTMAALILKRKHIRDGFDPSRAGDPPSLFHPLFFFARGELYEPAPAMQGRVAGAGLRTLSAAAVTALEDAMEGKVLLKIFPSREEAPG